jgi:hypothetical protein
MAGMRAYANFLAACCVLAQASLAMAAGDPCCRPPDAISAAAARQGVLQMAEAIRADLAKDGPAAWLRYFADGPAFFMAADGKLQFADVEAAKHFMPGFAAGVAHLELVWGEIRIDVLTPEMAMMAAPYSESFTAKTGAKSAFHGYFTGLAVRTPGGWKLRDLHWSSDNTAPAGG